MAPRRACPRSCAGLRVFRQRQRPHSVGSRSIQVGAVGGGGIRRVVVSVPSRDGQIDAWAGHNWSCAERQIGRKG
jgi:hypothetical protein